jgi:cell division protein FtsB
MVVAELGLTLSDAIILAAVFGAGLKVLADYRGWTRSPALVRQENADLRERNATLEADVKRLDAADREKAAQIAALEARIEELQKRDQAAVLDAISKHDESMVKLGEVLVMRGDEHERYAQSRRVEQKAEHLEAMGVWQEIRDTLTQAANKEAER